MTGADQAHAAQLLIDDDPPTQLQTCISDLMHDGVIDRADGKELGRLLQVRDNSVHVVADTVDAARACLEVLLATAAIGTRLRVVSISRQAHHLSFAPLEDEARIHVPIDDVPWQQHGGYDGPPSYPGEVLKDGSGVAASWAFGEVMRMRADVYVIEVDEQQEPNPARTRLGTANIGHIVYAWSVDNDSAGLYRRVRRQVLVPGLRGGYGALLHVREVSAMVNRYGFKIEKMELIE